MLHVFNSLTIGYFSLGHIFKISRDVIIFSILILTIFIILNRYELYTTNQFNHALILKIKLKT